MIVLIVFTSNHYIPPMNYTPLIQGMPNTVLLLYNIGKLKHCSIDEKEENKGMPLRLCLGISLPLVYRANITLEKDNLIRITIPHIAQFSRRMSE